MSYDTDNKPAETDEEIHKEALADFELCVAAEAHNREAALDDIKFARLAEQWHQADMDKRKAEGRPCLTINKMPAFIRQVVNDGRQNKPAIKVHPADDKADPETAEVINGLIRNIEYTSKADTAYDTGLDFAVTGGFGYWGVDMDYSHDDTFDMDLVIRRKPNPFAIYGDYESTGADSSDWNRAFEVDALSCEAFDAKYKGKDKTDWDSDAYKGMADTWRDGKNIIVASYWRRREVTRTICRLSDGRVVAKDWLAEPVMDEQFEQVTNQDLLDAAGITVEDERETLSYKVTQYIMNGVEILKTKPWAGRYIPLVPVYGEELNVEGKRYFRSLIRDAKDPQRNFNYWRSACTEMVALAPKAPFIGAAGQFTTDADKWASANTDSHPFIEYDQIDVNGQLAPPPQRQPFAGVPAGALQEAMNAADDMKAVTGIFDASLGARSNETSGRAINARKSESDTGTFHFIDNQARAIRHTGVILIDLIPHVYNKARIIRVMGIDKKPQNVPINQPQAGPQAPQQGQVVAPGQQVAEDGTAQVYNLTVGKYDLTVDTGPGFQTKREEAAYGMTELMRAFPPSAAVIGPHLAKAQDWPGAEEIGEELAALAPGANGQNPAVLQAQEQIKQIGQQLQQTQQEAQQMAQQLKDKSLEHEAAKADREVDAYKAHTDRIKALGLTATPEAAAAMGMQIAQSGMQALGDTLPGDEIAPEVTPEADAGEPAAPLHDMASVMQEMRELRRMMAAPRVKTLVRDPATGRATHAVEHVEMPPDEQEPQEPQPEMEGM